MSLFVSYSRDDETVVKQLVRGLESAQLAPWVDEALRGGDSWWSTILERIRSATVFVFALSDTSLASEPCRAELGYAEALGLPVLPVKVGPVSTYRVSTIFTVQLVNYDPKDASTAFEVISSVNRTTARRRDLPSPLPPEPPIPFAYLMAIGQQIQAGDLHPRDQLAVVDQLRRALQDERDTDVLADVRRMLRTLAQQPWATVAAATDARAALDGRPSKRQRVDPAAAAAATTATATATPGATPGDPVPGWYPDPTGRHPWRWYEGRWTPWVSHEGRIVSDPL